MSTTSRTPSDGDVVDLSRRHALQSGGLAIAFLWLGGTGPVSAMINARRQPGDAAAAMADGNPTFAPNAFIRVDTTGAVRLVMPSVEMGQGIYTGCSMLLAEELGVGLDQITVEHSPPSDELYGIPALGGQITGGSTSTRATWQVLREAGAVARTLLVTAAAAQWKVDPSTCTVDRGEIHHAPSARSVGFGEVATAAAKLPMPDKVQLTDPKDFKLLGKPMRRVDSPDKIKGATQFGIDVRVPGMKVATVVSCPTLGGKVSTVDDKAARAIPGVIDVLRIDDAVAVVGEHFWAAKQGVQALNVTWDYGPNATLDTQQLRDALADSAHNGQSIVASDTGAKPSGTLVQSEYQSPMLAHATMEPMNATVWVTADKCEIWTGTQVPMRAAEEGARITGLPIDKVVVHNQYLGGGFGRRLETDWVQQAVAFAKQVSYPVKVIWTREEDIHRDIVRPMYHDLISAVVDANGQPVWYGYRTSGGSVLARFAPGAMDKNGMDSDAVECVVEIPYDIPHNKVEWIRHNMPQGLVVGWWRGVGSTHNLFVVESFMDELAHRANKDPLEYRRALLGKSPRALAVLNLAAEKIGWGGQPLPARTARGISLGEPFGSHVCAIVEAEVTPQGEVRLRRVVVALDCGIAVNASSIEAQVQGGVLFGLSAALYNGITVKNGGFEQTNFNNYRSLRINEAPIVEVHRVINGEPPGGLGEVGTAIAAPALTNAIFAATGVRLYTLPVDRNRLVQNSDALKSVASASVPEGRDVA
ncbi:xanthine dehydrogenase family protein molybdopterin-binding subunit [Dyella dinghuensis]|uniref:Xanthine dehydrogenase family protein molybdopterin-binding subunit n=1 Tax=Dyella dinghuensis TaxID=1920169 RepID=A0A432LV82_9GAMM|nr:molybdopterin cofactor-binding domain-containing protein [Dyella dinghuensis]RUL65906.1 xanthine dehydrogenase family protein molybdopterin-binding subunit [Dyella dinghuensis]